MSLNSSFGPQTGHDESNQDYSKANINCSFIDYSDRFKMSKMFELKFFFQGWSRSRRSKLA
jgi:hypothetical protein